VNTLRRKRRPLWVLAVAIAVLAAFSRSGFQKQDGYEDRVVSIREVVDGDTVETQDGTRIRYIGIDTPEVRRRTQRGWVYDPQPYALEGTELNRSLVGGRSVRIELDEERRDRFGRLLAYVFLEDGTFVNERLIRAGMARVLIIPPNTRYGEEFKKAEREARLEGIGIWQNRE